MKCKAKKSKSEQVLTESYPLEELREIGRERRVAPAAVRLAHHYLASEDISPRPDVQQLLRRFEQAVRREFAHLKRQVSINFTLVDPYSSIEELAQDVAENNHLEVFAGGMPISYLSPEVNTMARAVHDMLDHLPELIPFDLAGEVRAWQRAAKREPDLAALTFSENVLQSSTFEALGFFPDLPQKIVPVSPDLISTGLTLLS